ncbi:hypothetical protein HPP92_008308 [Vanilla planifolia]|uniref:Uncharacterized protein n=1 Tax=Vanilla planifolia TaxID=51239 RepID=A0A835RH18_VANPL|nr:hypothetical protein HPP92_008308 [Vanilla planifolia]
MATGELKGTLLPARRLRSQEESGGELHEEDDEERQIEELEREVKEMAQKILDFRSIIPERLGDALSTRLAALRPNFPPVNESLVYQADTKLPANGGDERQLEKFKLFREKTINSIAAAPLLLKRVNESLEKLNKIDSCNLNIHHAFKWKNK